MKAVILDGYVDEPSLLGVPPYISPEPRMLAGVCEEADIDWCYLTADQYREEGLPEGDILLVHGGVTVPGNYLGGTPLSPRESGELLDFRGETFLGGPLARYGEVEGYDHQVEKDLSAYFHDFLKGKAEDRWTSLDERNRWLVSGARAVEEHPLFPDPLLAEISLYRGCVRYFTGGCSFCSEPKYGKPEFRDRKDVIEEIKELYGLGLRHFRVGGQSCTVSYKAEGVGDTEKPTPRPGEMDKLLKGIWEDCPEIKVLHLDNANPAVMAEHEEKAREILKTFVEYTTPGNILALGMESADPEVIRKNNLNAAPEEVKKAVKMINDVGRERGENGMPKLLPGINFLGGLKGETEKTYERNFKFLKRLRKQGLWMRRINIRQVLGHQEDFQMGHKKEFKRFKEKVNEEIDRPLLEEMLPKGTVLRDVYMEKRDGKTTFGRQIGTYPLLVGVEYPLELEKYYDIAVTDHGYRSVTGVKYPLNPSEASYRELKALPGIGEKRAAKIFRKEPESLEDIRDIIGEKTEDIKKYLKWS